MSLINKIGFVGTYKCDLILYLAKIVAFAGKKVAIVDACEEDVWKYNVPVYLDSKVITYYDIDIYLDCKTMRDNIKLDLSNYDIVFFDFGFNKDLAQYIKECDALVIVSTMEKHIIMKLRECLKTIRVMNSETEDNDVQGKKTDIIKIYRDVVSCKISTKYVDSLLDIDDMVNVVLEYILSFDEIGYKCRIENQYNDFIKFNKLPKTFKTMLIDIIRGCTDLNEKQIKKSLNKAERGT